MALAQIDPMLRQAIQRFCKPNTPPFGGFLPNGSEIVAAHKIVLPVPFEIWDEEHNEIAARLPDLGEYVWADLEQGVSGNADVVFDSAAFLVQGGVRNGGIRDWLGFSVRNLSMLQHAAYFESSRILHCSMGDISGFFVVDQQWISENIWLSFWRDFACHCFGSSSSYTSHFDLIHKSSGFAAPPIDLLKSRAF